MLRRARVLALAAAALAGCSSEPPAPVSVALTLGREPDAISRAPAVTSLTITATSGEHTVASATAAPGGTFDLGDFAEGTALAFEAAGTDAQGETVLRGRTPSGLVLGEIDPTVPLFVQRLGAWARPPGDLAHAHTAAPATVVGERWILTTGGTGDDAKQTEFYDLTTLSAERGTAPFPRRAETLVSLVDSVIVIGDGGATKVDLGAQATGELAAPAPLATFGGVAGAAPTFAPDGTQLVIGATRAAGGKDVLVVRSDGSLGALATSSARKGAAAAWIDPVGLVVAGGADDAAGIEVLTSPTSSFGARPFDPDATSGAALVATGDGTNAALVGGTIAGAPAPTRTFDAACTMACTLTEVPGAAVPLVARTQAYSLGGGRVLAVGDDASGETRAFLVDLGAATATELPLREPRTGATAVPGPDGLLYVIGGVHLDGTPALALERFFP